MFPPNSPRKPDSSINSCLESAIRRCLQRCLNQCVQRNLSHPLPSILSDFGSTLRELIARRRLRLQQQNPRTPQQHKPQPLQQQKPQPQKPQPPKHKTQKQPTKKTGYVQQSTHETFTNALQLSLQRGLPALMLFPLIRDLMAQLLEDMLEPVKLRLEDLFTQALWQSFEQCLEANLHRYLLEGLQHCLEQYLPQLVREWHDQHMNMRVNGRVVRISTGEGMESIRRFIEPRLASRIYEHFQQVLMQPVPQALLQALQNCLLERPSQ